MLPVELFLEIAAKLSPADLLKLSHSSSFLYKLVKCHLKKIVESPEILNIHDEVLIFFSLSAGNQPVYPNGQTLLSKASQFGLLRTIDMCSHFNVKDELDVYSLLAAGHAKNYATLECLVRLGYSSEGVLDVIIPKWSQIELIKAVELIGNVCANKSVIYAVSRNFGFLVQKLQVTDECLQESVKFPSRFKITQDLVSRCDINSQEPFGLTALHVAVKMKNAKGVQSLVQHGASLTLRTPCGKNATDLCCKEMLPFLKI